MALRLPERFRLPPFLPAYALLCIVLIYTAGTLWLGLARLTAIAQYAESTANSAATIRALESLLNAVTEIESSARGFALSGDEAHLQSFERRRTVIPPLLARLRDSMRDDSTKLSMIESLVPLIAEHSTLSASVIEHRRSAPESTLEPGIEQRSRDSAAAIRSTLEAIEAREQDRLNRNGATLALSLRDARRDLFLMSGLTLLMVLALFRAVKRLRAFLLFLPTDGTQATSVGAEVLSASDARTGTLLRDALLRIRMASARASPQTPAAEQLNALLATTERAIGEHARLSRDADGHLEEDDVPTALSRLATMYSRTGGLKVKPVIDQKVRVSDPQKAFLLFRSAEWALEVIAPRKRTGEASLQLAAKGDDIFLRVSALADQPDVAITLTPKEAEDSAVLQQAATALVGTLIVQESSTGFSLSVKIPVDA